MKLPRLTWTALSLACLVPLLSAAPQMTPAKKLTKPGQEKAAKPKTSPAQQEFKRLTDKVRQAQRDFYKKQSDAAKKAKEAGGPIPAMRMNMDLSAFAVEALEGAKKYAGTDDAIQFLVFTLNVTKDKKITAQAGEILLRDHLNSPKMPEFVAMTLGRVQRNLGQESTTKLLEACMKSDSGALQGAVHFYRGSLALRNRKISDEDKKAAHEEMRQAIKLAPEASFSKRAEGILFEVDHLQVGMKAPDITGKDTDGVAFKTSDYLGKVILLDFWGDW